MANKNTICLWYDGTAADAARFYAETFPDSAVGKVMRAPGDYPDGKQGDVLTVEFTVFGIPCVGLNGGPQFKHNEAFSFQIATDDQAETDRLWNAIARNGGQERQCGWCKDKWGISWQITPRVLIAALSDPDRAAAKRAFDRARECEKAIAKDGISIPDRYGTPRQHPLLAVLKDANNTLLAALKALDVDPDPVKPRIGRPPGKRGER